MTRTRTRTRTSVLAAERAIESAALAYGDPPAAVTFAEGFLEDERAFFRAMDAVSHGRFLGEHRSSTTAATTTTPGRHGKARPQTRSNGGVDGERVAARGATLGGGGSGGGGSCGGGGGGGGKAKLALGGGGKKGAGSGVGGAGPGDLSELLKKVSTSGGGGGGRGAAMAEGWRQLPWLTETGGLGFSLAAFLANR